MTIEDDAICECVICAELAGKGDTDFHRRTHAAIPSRILGEAHGFVFLPDVAPIVPGHLLIVTAAHAVAMSALESEALRQLDRVMCAARKVLMASYKRPIVFFEHGALDEFDRAGCCVYHAHMHALPAAVDVTAALEKLYNSARLERLEELQRYSSKRFPYLFFQRADGERFGYAPVRAVPQIIRRLICMELSLPERSNWETAVDVSMIRETLVELGPAFRDWGVRRD